jgi:hypothetical protein
MQGDAMGDDDRVPSTQQMMNLVQMIGAVLCVWRDVPPRLRSDSDKLDLLMALGEFEYVGKDEHMILVRGWPPEVPVALRHLRDLSRELASRWGLAPVRRWGTQPSALAGGPILESPFTAEEDEIALLSSLKRVLISALGGAVTGEQRCPPLRVVPEIPLNAIACSQAQIARTIGQAARGGLVEKLKAQEVLSFAERIKGQLYVVFRDPYYHGELKALVAKEKARRRRASKPPKTRE